MTQRGTVLLRNTGAPEKVYGRPCGEERLEHEIWITEVEILIGGRFTRNAPVGKTTADTWFVRDGEWFWVEVDNGTMTSKQMRKKWERYLAGPERKVNGLILVICHTKTRLRRLLRTAAPVKDFILFTRFRWLRSKAVQEPWIDGWCKRVGI